MKLTSIPEREEQVSQLKTYFAEQADGEDLSWLRIEADTGIKMNALGRDLVRNALKKLRRPYEAVRGEGVRLSSPDNTMTIMKGRFARIDNSVRRADRTRHQLSERHLEQLSAVDKQKMLTLAGFFGAVRAFAGEAAAKLLPPKEPKT
jgi:hypothetical protein